MFYYQACYSISKVDNSINYLISETWQVNFLGLLLNFPDFKIKKYAGYGVWFSIPDYQRVSIFKAMELQDIVRAHEIKQNLEKYAKA
jgi:hypothetical protein